MFCCRISPNHLLILSFNNLILKNQIVSIASVWVFTVWSYRNCVENGSKLMLKLRCHGRVRKSYLDTTLKEVWAQLYFSSVIFGWPFIKTLISDCPWAAAETKINRCSSECEERRMCADCGRSQMKQADKWQHCCKCLSQRNNKNKTLVSGDACFQLQTNKTHDFYFIWTFYLC